MKSDSFRVIAFDLDGTLTQHKTPLTKQNRDVLDALKGRYRLLIVGAGQCGRIFRQMEGYPIDIIGNYGMQFSQYDMEREELCPVYDEISLCDRQSVAERITKLRKAFGYEHFVGESVEFHASGCVTFPLLGTKAELKEKLAFDPDRSIRRPLYPAVREAFPDYTVFIGGSSSFDFAPAPYNKYYALDQFCHKNGFSHREVLYCGDDYGEGGNDEAVYHSDFPFLCVEDYTRIRENLNSYMEETVC